MKILALETSAKAVSVAAAEGGALLASRFANEGQTHSVTLMPMLQEMLREAELTGTYQNERGGYPLSTR